MQRKELKTYIKTSYVIPLSRSLIKMLEYFLIQLIPLSSHSKFYTWSESARQTILSRVW